MELWSLAEGLLAEGTLVEHVAPSSSSLSIPVGRQTGLAEAVAAWCCDWVVEHLQTD